MKINHQYLQELIKEEVQIYLFEQKVLLWEQRSLNEIAQVLNEDIWSVLAKAKDWTATKIKNLWKKVSDFILKKSVEAIEYISRGSKALFSGLKVLSAMTKKIGIFCQNHKTACQLAVATLASVVVFGAMSLFASNAEAAVSQGKEIIDQKTVDGLKGFLVEYDKHTRGNMSDTIAKTIAWIDDLNKAKNVTDITKLTGEGSDLMNLALKKVQVLSNTEPELFDDFAKLGSKVSAYWQKVIGPFSTKIQSAIRISKGQQ